MIIRHSKPFWTGIVWSALIFTGFLLKDHVGTSGSGPSIQYWPWWGWLLLSTPGILFIFAGIRPESLPGLVGLFLFDLLASRYRGLSRKK